ncbi:MAG: aminopeptidase P family N-terminal domain-containing protein, partial [Nitrospirota bacterium]|nr:aminopeptidase P family N-terminal domain-containing protein [Nitrospirota bacterium]
MTPPPRGFSAAEFQHRTGRAQQLMAVENLDALLLTTAHELRYFSGFLTRFWESPTRPWFLIVPASGKPIAVIPTIGADLMSKTWLDDIRTWSAPRPEDDGVFLLADTLREVSGPQGRIGVPMGHETSLRMPLADFSRVREAAPIEWVDATAIMQTLNRVKSGAEIAKIAHICAVAGRAFDHIAAIAGTGIPLDNVFRDFQINLLREGADWVAYLAGGAGPGGYGDVISLPTDRPLQPGDVLMLDTGACHDGYFCDFDRNYAIGG